MTLTRRAAALGAAVFTLLAISTGAVLARSGSDPSAVAVAPASEVVQTTTTVPAADALPANPGPVVTTIPATPAGVVEAAPRSIDPAPTVEAPPAVEAPPSVPATAATVVTAPSGPEHEHCAIIRSEWARQVAARAAGQAITTWPAVTMGQMWANANCPGPVPGP